MAGTRTYCDASCRVSRPRDRSFSIKRFTTSPVRTCVATGFSTYLTPQCRWVDGAVVFRVPLDTTSILKDAIAVYNSLSLVFRNWMTISTNGTLSMMAQCAYLASYKVPLVVRQGVMLRSTSSSQPVDCSTPQPSTVPRPSSTVPFASFASENPSTSYTTTAILTNSVFLSSTPVNELPLGIFVIQ
ncbi:hypothetical protein EMCRGX_G012181 [Ephydatia muelleri]